MSLGNNISFLRKQKKLTQEQLADRMSVTRQTVSRWESDEVVPELNRLVEMCGIFACKLDTLVRADLSCQSEIYSEIKIKINECKNKMQKAMSYQMFRDAWLDVKKEIECMVYQEEIIYIRHL